MDKARLFTCINTESGGSSYFPMVVTPFLWQDLVQWVQHSPEISNVSLLRHTSNFLKSWLNQMDDHHTECSGKSQSSQTSPVMPESNIRKGTLGKRKGQF